MKDSIRRNEARKLMRRWAKIDEEIEAAEMAYKALCDEIDMIASIPSPVQKLNGMPHQDGISNLAEDVALRRIQLAEAYRGRLSEYNNKVIEGMRFKLKMQDAMIFCDAEAIEVITLKWKQRMRMELVADSLHISRSTVWRYERIVLDAVADEFNL